MTARQDRDRAAAAGGVRFWLQVAARERGCASAAAAARCALGTALAGVALGSGAALLVGSESGAGLEAVGGPAAEWILAAAMGAAALAYVRRGLWAPRRDLPHPVSRRELAQATRTNALVHNLAFLAALALAAGLAHAALWLAAGAADGVSLLPGGFRALPVLFVLTALVQWALARREPAGPRFTLRSLFIQEDAP